jgi:multicomponent Na+:H+ antiporter subunit G
VIETARTSATILLVVLGLFFTLVSTVGVLRLPDIYSRVHTASEADTLGAGFTLAGVALALGWSTTTAKTVLLLFFIFVTNPTAAHAISRAAHEDGIQPWTTEDDSTDRELYESARKRRGQERGPATDPSAGGTQPASDGGTRPAGNGGESDLAGDGSTRPAGDGDSGSAHTGAGGER